MNHSESVAKGVVEAVIRGSQMTFRSDQSSSVCDFDLQYEGGKIAAAEVTACVDQESEETAAAIRQKKKGGRAQRSILSARKRMRILRRSRHTAWKGSSVLGTGRGLRVLKESTRTCACLVVP